MKTFFRNARRLATRAALVPALAVAVVACDDDDPTTPRINQDIVEIAAATADVSTLVAALQAAELTAALQGDGPFTVFAPVNSAFSGLGADVVARLLEPGNKTLLTEILTYHVVPGAAVFSGDLSNGQTVTTLQGESLTIGVSGATVTVNGASVVTADIEGTNGVIHLIDGVLTPELDIVEKALLTSQTQTLVDAVVAGELVSTLQGAGPFTVFAPVNSAFEALGDFTLNSLLDPANKALLQRILTYHVVPGKVLSTDLVNGDVATAEGSSVAINIDGAAPTVNGASVVAADIEVANGVIHLIDGVLTPELDIVEKASITEQTQTLVAAVAAGDLVSTLQGAGPFTVFAPVDAAFEALGTDKLDVLLAAENQSLLQKILTYHVVPGKVLSTDLANGEVTTAQGSTVTINIDGAAPTVNGASVVAADIEVANGVIHLIDGVLTENLDLVDVAIVNGFSTLTSLVDQQGLTSTLRTDNGGAGFTVFAPTEAAFAALSSVPSGDALTQILLYHVVGAEVGSGSLSDGQVVTSANGAGDTFTVNIDGTSGAVTLTDGAGNTVGVVVTDVPAANGIIHVIDGVILPGN